MNALRLFGWTGAVPPERAAYEAIVAAARHPKLYEDYGVPDTVDGRFDMIVLHLFLALDRVRHGADSKFGQALLDEMFRDMDGSLREMGTSDPTVAKKVRKMAEVYVGRVAAYSASIGEETAFAEVLRRNVFAGGPGDAERLAAYVLHNQTALAQQDVKAICKGSILFIEPA